MCVCVCVPKRGREREGGEGQTVGGRERDGRKLYILCVHGAKMFKGVTLVSLVAKPVSLLKVRKHSSLILS